MTHRLSPDALAVGLLLATLCTFFLLACSGANGDPAPEVPEAGADAGAVLVNCVDGAVP